MKYTSADIINDLSLAADPERAKSSAWFFKTGAGQYGEGDVFIGIAVPVQRKIALRYRNLPLAEIKRLLRSKIHEHRFVALEILVAQYEAADPKTQQHLFDFYLENAARINNWDLVDTSAPYIVGEHLKNRPRTVLRKLARSANLWERRIAIVSTLGLLKTGETAETFRIAGMLLADKHDLIHKAVGWALREAGKKSESDLRAFLSSRYASLPRTTLRYAIERFPAERRKRMLSGKFD